MVRVTPAWWSRWGCGPAPRSGRAPPEMTGAAPPAAAAGDLRRRLRRRTDTAECSAGARGSDPHGHPSLRHGKKGLPLEKQGGQNGDPGQILRGAEAFGVKVQTPADGGVAGAVGDVIGAVVRRRPEKEGVGGGEVVGPGVPEEGLPAGHGITVLSAAIIIQAGTERKGSGKMRLIARDRCGTLAVAPGGLMARRTIGGSGGGDRVDDLEKKLNVPTKIAHVLNERNVVWAVGASMLLYLRGIVDVFHDIDLMVCESDVEKLKEQLLPMGVLAPPKPDQQYKTRHFFGICDPGS